MLMEIFVFLPSWIPSFQISDPITSSITFSWQGWLPLTRENKHHHMETAYTSGLKLTSQHPHVRPPLGTRGVSKVTSLHLCFGCTCCHLKDFLCPLSLHELVLFSNLSDYRPLLRKKTLGNSQESLNFCDYNFKTDISSVLYIA